MTQRPHLKNLLLLKAFKAFKSIHHSFPDPRWRLYMVSSLHQYKVEKSSHIWHNCLINYWNNHQFSFNQLIFCSPLGDWSAGVLITLSERIDWLQRSPTASVSQWCHISRRIVCGVFQHGAIGPWVALISRITASIQIRGGKQRPSVCSEPPLWAAARCWTVACEGPQLRGSHYWTVVEIRIFPQFQKIFLNYWCKCWIQTEI